MYSRNQGRPDSNLHFVKALRTSSSPDTGSTRGWKTGMSNTTLWNTSKWGKKLFTCKHLHTNDTPQMPHLQSNTNVRVVLELAQTQPGSTSLSCHVFLVPPFHTRDGYFARSSWIEATPWKTTSLANQTKTTSLKEKAKNFLNPVGRTANTTRIFLWSNSAHLCLFYCSDNFYFCWNRCDGYGPSTVLYCSASQTTPTL